MSNDPLADFMSIAPSVLEDSKTFYTGSSFCSMNKMSTARVICPLYNFSVSMLIRTNSQMSRAEIASLHEARRRDTVEGVEVYDGVKIKYISKQDYEALEHGFWLLPPDTKVRSNMFVLEKDTSTVEDQDFQLENLMANIVFALRLLKKSYVSGNAVLYLQTHSGEPHLPVIEWSWERQRKLETFGAMSYVFKLEELPELKELIQKVQNLDLVKRKDLKLARERFERAYEEDDLEDQLIDIMIAFESLFLKGEKGNVPHGRTIAVGCSCLLGKNEEQRVEIESFLTEAYRIRNCVVHGSEYGKPTVGKEYEMSEFVSRIEDYLRESLKRLLD